MKIAIIGAAGFGQCVAETIELNGDNVVGFFDDNPNLREKRIMGRPVLGKVSEVGWFKQKFDRAVITIGGVRIRQSIHDLLQREGIRLANVLHPSAIIAPSTKIGDGAIIRQGCIICANTYIGMNTILHSNTLIEHDCRVGNHCQIGPSASVAGLVDMGDRILIGMNVSVINKSKIGNDVIIASGVVAQGKVPDRAVVKCIVGPKIIMRKKLIQ